MLVEARGREQWARAQAGHPAGSACCSKTHTVNSGQTDCRSYTHPHPHTLSLSLTHQTHTHSLSLSHTHTHTHTLPSLSHTHTPVRQHIRETHHSHPHPHIYTRACTDTDTLKAQYSLYYNFILCSYRHSSCCTYNLYYAAGLIKIIMSKIPTLRLKKSIDFIWLRLGLYSYKSFLFVVQPKLFCFQCIVMEM